MHNLAFHLLQDVRDNLIGPIYHKKIMHHLASQDCTFSSLYALMIAK